jgi:hypothetical protein
VETVQWREGIILNKEMNSLTELLVTNVCQTQAIRKPRGDKVNVHHAVTTAIPAKALITGFKSPSNW